MSELGLNVIPDYLRTYLSAATRQAFDAGNPLSLTTENFKEIAATQRGIGVSLKLERILEFIARRVGAPGSSVAINPANDFPLHAATSPAELTEYLAFLDTEGLIKGPAQGLGLAGNYTLTINGWQKLEPLLPAEGEPDRCFVAMWFDDSLDDVYENGFAQAVRDCNFKPHRVKGDPTNKSVIDNILAEIRRSRFVVADFTGQRPSVYYETGFAHGIGREIIGCCRKDHIDGLAFDTRHLGHVVWQDAEDLRRKLANSIQANIIPKG